MCAAARAPALDFWQYPEMADRHSVFAGAFVASFSLDHEYLFDLAPELHVDYVLAVGFPVSIGLSVRPFTEGVFAVGIRPGYHINLDSLNSNLYFLFTVDLVWRDAGTYLDFGPRIGFRRRFGRVFCLHAETGHKFQSINLGVSLKIN